MTCEILDVLSCPGNRYLPPVSVVEGAAVSFPGAAGIRGDLLQ